MGTGTRSLPRAELEQVALALDRTRWAASIYDPGWRLVWVSQELAGVLGSSDEEELGLGEHLLAVSRLPLWERAVTADSRLTILEENIAYVLYDTPGGSEELAGLLEDRTELAVLERAEPSRPPPMWSYGIDYVPRDGPPVHVHSVTLRLRDGDGKLIGNVVVSHTGLPAGLTAQLVRGDRGMFERMARLADPGQHAAAILFADLEHSGKLSRHVPTALYFALIRHVTDAMDRAIVKRLGIVGKHAGDGVSAFFLAEDLGSPEASIAAAIDAGREIAAAAERAGEELRSEVPGAEAVRVNAGVHWGATVFIGQVATEGRLEVTALGDEVIEAARIQQSAAGGALLISKTALERISAEQSGPLDVDPSHARYTTIAELPEASEKARRDAGAIAVTRL